MDQSYSNIKMQGRYIFLSMFILAIHAALNLRFEAGANFYRSIFLKFGPSYLCYIQKSIPKF